MKSAGQAKKMTITRFARNMPTIFKWVSFLTVLFLPVLAMAAGAETKPMSVEYRDVPGIGSRNLIWIVAPTASLACWVCFGCADFCLGL